MVVDLGLEEWQKDRALGALKEQTRETRLLRKGSQKEGLGMERKGSY